MHDHNIQIQHKAWVIRPLQNNNKFLMEVLQELGLNQSQMERINACHMYLQVTMLAEIVDHTGMTILPQVLCCQQAQSLQGLDKISQSKLCWPCIHQPSQSSWKLWTSTICNLFSGTPNGTLLQHKLGEWTDSYQATRIWKWWLPLMDPSLIKNHLMAMCKQPSAHKHSAPSWNF